MVACCSGPAYGKGGIGKLVDVLNFRRHDERLWGILAAQATQDVGVLSQANVLFGARGELAGAKGLPVVKIGRASCRERV